MKNKTADNWFLGIFLVASAIVLVGQQLDWFDLKIGFWTGLLTLILATTTLKSLFHLNFGGFSFSLGFLAILHAKNLGIENLVPWTILLAALLVAVGLNLLFAPLKRKRQSKNRHQFVASVSHHEVEDEDEFIDDEDDGDFDDVFDEDFMQKDDDDNDDWTQFDQTFSTSAKKKFKSTRTADGQTIEISQRFGSTTRYIQSDDFRYGNVNLFIGEIKIFFDATTISQDSAQLEINGLVGQIDLYVPHHWQIENQLESSVIDFSEKNAPKLAATGPHLYLTGRLKVAEIVIHYI
ncbi:LiaF transmembrane domain-containing protein [Enterococcus timonensis]|uniref:LiaF transmembrane domain-containing protein n=1 Tax=Enterococcus timonensis TaxID=1852364 RepID=UPI0008D8F94F|nr:LiaF domain-containing protein [Enterococcus timonensis]